MSYTQITAHVVDQTLQLPNLPPLASGGVGSIQVKFNFCPMWDGYGKTAVFYRNPADVYHITIVDNTAEIPHEVMPDKGYFFFGVMGVADNVRTTEIVRVEYKQGAITTATTNHEDPTPNIYQQLLAAYGSAEQAIAVERARIDELVAVRGTGDTAEVPISTDYITGTIYTNGTSAYLHITVNELTLSANETYYTDYFIAPELAPSASMVLTSFLTDIEAYIEPSAEENGLQARLAIRNRQSYELAGTYSGWVVYPLASLSVPELADVRVGYDGATYGSAGEAVRESFGKLAPVIVTHEIGSTQCSHTADEIYTHVKAGRKVVLAWNGSWYVPLTEATKSQANFDRSTFNAQGAPILVSLTIDSDGILTRTGSTLATQEQLAEKAVIDDSAVGADAWSSKNIVDKLCPAFTESGLIVTCEPVEGYPLAVATDAAATAITRCGKNLINYTATSKTTYGVTFTVNEDKTITANGTSTGTIYFTIGKVKLVSGVAYRLSGCPADGNGTTYNLYISSAVDIGSGKKFTASATQEYILYFYVAKGLTLNNAVIKPMVRQADTPSTYEPPKAVETFNPGETIHALPGINTIFTDAGEVTVTGRADPNAINRKTAERLAALEAALVNT